MKDPEIYMDILHQIEDTCVGLVERWEFWRSSFIKRSWQAFKDWLNEC